MTAGKRQRAAWGRERASGRESYGGGAERRAGAIVWALEGRPGGVTCDMGTLEGVAYSALGTASIIDV